jgi:hypothetical protein
LSIHGGLGRGERPAGERERERSIRDLLYIEQSLSPGSSLDAGAPLLSLSRTTPPISVFFFFFSFFFFSVCLYFLFRYRCHREKNKKIRRPKKNLRRSMGIISVTNWPHHRLSLSVCVCMLAESPAQPTDQPSFLFHWTRSRFFPYFIFSSSSFWFAPLSEWALSSSPNSPTTIPHRPALFFFFFHVWLRFSSCDVRILN